jgi:hypothetical protein
MEILFMPHSVLEIHPVVIHFLEGALHGDVSAPHLVGRHLKKVQEALGLPVMGGPVLVKTLDFGHQVSEKVLLQGERIAHLLTATPADLLHAFPREQPEGLQYLKTLQPIQSGISQKVLEKGMWKEAQGAGHRICRSHAQTALAPRLHGITLGPESVNVVTESFSLQDNIQGAAEGDRSLKASRALTAGLFG